VYKTAVTLENRFFQRLEVGRWPSL